MMRLLKMAVALALVYWLVQSQHLDLSTIGKVIFSQDYLYCVALLLDCLGLQIGRWLLLLRRKSVPITLAQTTRIYFIGQFFFTTSLGSVAAEAARGYYISRYAPGKRVAAISTVIVDRALGLYTLTLLGSVVMLMELTLSRSHAGVLEMGGVEVLLFLGLSLLFYLVSHPPLRRWVLSRLPDRLQKRIRVVLDSEERSQPVGGMSRIIALSLMTNITFVVTFKLAAELMGSSVGWYEIFLIVPLVTIANALPISFGGLGVGEATTQALMALVGISNGASIMLLIRVSFWILFVPLGALFYMMEGGSRSEERESVPEG